MVPLSFPMNAFECDYRGYYVCDWEMAMYVTIRISFGDHHIVRHPS